MSNELYFQNARAKIDLEAITPKAPMPTCCQQFAAQQQPLGLTAYGTESAGILLHFSCGALRFWLFSWFLPVGAPPGENG